jgi:hypothetical protein
MKNESRQKDGGRKIGERGRQNGKMTSSGFFE